MMKKFYSHMQLAYDSRISIWLLYVQGIKILIF